MPSISLKRTRSATTEPPRKRVKIDMERLTVLQADSPKTGIYNKEDRQLYVKQCYDFGSSLGSGSFANVVSVTSRRSKRSSAIKINREPFKFVGQYQEALSEARIHQELPPHTNIVGFLAAWSESRLLFVKTELCVSDLRVFAKSPLFTTRVLVHAAVDIIAGISHLHANDVLHVDIKPDNVFVTSSGVCKIGDFGVAVRIEDAKRGIDGDGRYAPIDLLNGAPTTKTDVFSLAMTILEVASGVAAQEIKTMSFTEEEAIRGLLKSHDLEEFVELVHAGLSEDPSQRPEAAEMLKIAKRIVKSHGERPVVAWSVEEEKIAATVLSRLPIAFVTPRACLASPKAGFNTSDLNVTPRPFHSDRPSRLRHNKKVSKIDFSGFD